MSLASCTPGGSGRIGAHEAPEHQQTLPSLTPPLLASLLALGGGARGVGGAAR